MSASFPEVELEWQGQTYRCRATFDVLSQIEQKVALNKLAYTIIFDRDNVPMTHIAWVFYCLLYSAGAQCTPEQVWHAIRRADGIAADQLSEVMKFVIQETYEVTAESQPSGQSSGEQGKGKGGGKKRGGRRRRNRSPSKTSTQSQ